MSEPLLRRVCGVALALLLLLGPIRGAVAAGWFFDSGPRPPAPPSSAERPLPKRYYDTVPPEERGRMQRQYQEWQTLPPDQRDAMRRRMDDWNRLPPQERDRLQQRYRQFQQLPQEERRSLENNLRRWDNLSPQERDSIRRRFKD
jgi:hypothetical protein